jgi:hypothetical protein
VEKGELLLGALKDFADSYDSGLRLVFALTTGATLLFAHSLIEVTIPKPLVLIAGLCVLAFGTASVHCAGTIMSFAKLRLKVFAHAARQGDVDALDVMFADVRTRGERAERLFQAGVVLSMIFVSGLVLARLLK